MRWMLILLAVVGCKLDTRPKPFPGASTTNPGAPIAALQDAPVQVPPHQHAPVQPISIAREPEMVAGMGGQGQDVDAGQGPGDSPWVSEPAAASQDHRKAHAGQMETTEPEWGTDCRGPRVYVCYRQSDEHLSQLETAVAGCTLSGGLAYTGEQGTDQYVFCDAAQTYADAVQHCSDASLVLAVPLTSAALSTFYNWARTFDTVWLGPGLGTPILDDARNGPLAACNFANVP